MSVLDFADAVNLHRATLRNIGGLIYNLKGNNLKLAVPVLAGHALLQLFPLVRLLDIESSSSTASFGDVWKCVSVWQWHRRLWCYHRLTDLLFRAVSLVLYSFGPTNSSPCNSTPPMQLGRTSFPVIRKRVSSRLDVTPLWSKFEE